MPEGAATAQAREQRQQQRTRQRFARRQWARRWIRWKVVVAVAAVLTLLATGIWFVAFSDALSVHRVKVTGNTLLSDQRVERVAGVPDGQQVAFVDLTSAQRRVAGLAEVEAVEVTRAWPDGVLVEVTERTAVAVVELGGRLRGLDAAGVVFRDYKQPPPGLPKVRPTTSTGSDALKEAAGVVATLPDDLAATVDHVEVETIDRITLMLRDGRQVLWGSAEESELKAQVLQGLLRKVRAPSYDVSVPGNPVYGPVQ